MLVPMIVSGLFLPPLPLRRNRCKWRSVIAALALPAIVAPCTALASAARIDDLAAEQMSVRELMRLDTELALSHAKNTLRKDGGAGADSRGQYARSGALKLVAIYGVGKKLLAEVTDGTQSYIYMRGQALPVGGKAGASTYMLNGMSGSCVQLERKGEAHTLCLHPALWTAK